MQKLVEYSNYTSNSDPNYGIYISNSITYYGDFNTIDNTYYYNYDEFNKEKNIDVSSYVNDMLFNEFSTNEDFFSYMFNSYKFIRDSLDTEHLNKTFDYYTVTYNFLRYNYLSKTNKNEEYSNYIDFTYIIDNYNYEYDTSYSNYCNYLQLWDNYTKETTITPFYIKILNDNVKLKLTANQTIKFSYLSDNHKNYAIEKNSVEFNKVCYIKDVRLDRADNDYNYDISLFNFIVKSNENNENIKCEIGGNILSLLKQDLGLISYKGFNKFDNNNNALITYFSSFFKDNIYIYKANKLYIPLLDVSTYMYNNMFSGCTNLTYGPTLLFQNINSYACKNMFSGCKNLSYLTLLTYNYAIYDIDASANTVIVNDIRYSYMFDNWLPENLTNNLNLTLNSNVKKHCHYSSYDYVNYLLNNADKDNINISYI